MSSSQMPAAGRAAPQLAPEFCMCDDSDDECQPGFRTGSAQKKSAPKHVQNFCLSDDSEDDGAVTPPPPPLSPPRKAPQFFPLPEDGGSEKSVSPSKSLRSVHHREGLGFSLCDDSDAEDVTEHSGNKKQTHPMRATASEDRPVDTAGLYKLGGARILGKHLAAVHKDANPGKTRSSAGSIAPSVEEDDVASVASAAESWAPSETSTISKGSGRRTSRAQHDSGAAARLFGRQLRAVKSDIAVDAAAEMIVKPDGVKGHVDDVMGNLSLRQRQEVQRHIDTVMRSAAERMGYKTLEDKQDLCARTNDAICNALEKQHSKTDYIRDHSAAVDPEWDLALRAKIRLAMCAARERRSAEGLEQAIAAARSAAAEKRGMGESQVYQDIESRILWAAHEACLQRGGPEVEAEASWMPAYSRGVPAAARSKQPRVEIPADKLDECIKRIMAEAKARTEAKEQTSMNTVFRGQRSHPLARAALLDDAELDAYFKKVVAQSACRAGESESNRFHGEVSSPLEWGGCAAPLSGQWSVVLQ